MAAFQHSSFAATVVVGPTSCSPSFVHFSSIQLAVNSVPTGSTVRVCPGTYNEQVHIVQPVTVTGITFNNSDEAVIAPPPGGLVVNASNTFGQAVAAQLWVDSVVGGPVNISNMVVDGTGNAVASCLPLVVGVLYQNSSGTLNEITARNQIANTCGQGILAEGGSALPTVTIQNSSVHDVDNSGIQIDTNAGTPQLTATVKGNTIINGGNAGIVFGHGSNGTVSGNVITAIDTGIAIGIGAVTGTVSGNTILNAPTGIKTTEDSVSISANKVVDSSVSGISVNTAVAAIKSNIVTDSNIGIEFNCVADPNVISNTITDALTGIDTVPVGLSVPNRYFGVGTLRTGC
ncbi:MAG TPA: right-handed parallel beta-helix repeat-containing protein [Terriglobales bacterium]